MRRELVGVLGLVGCSEPDTTPPELLAAAFVEPEPGFMADRVVLRFSEPLGPIADVDPEHFRLSTALVIDDGEGAALTVYYDLANHFEGGLPGQDGHAPALALPRHAFTRVAALERGEHDDELVLVLSYPLESPVCEALAMATQLGIPNGIFVHYAEAERPRIVDAAGNALPDIAAHWLDATGVATQAGTFPQLDVALAIPCR